MITLCYFELPVRINKDTPFKNQSKRVIKNSKYKHLLYQTLTFLSVALLVYFTIGYLMPISSMLIWILIAEFPVAITIYFLKQDWITNDTATIQSHYDDYFHAMSDMNPREGMRYIIEYIMNPSNNCPQEHHKGFLEYLV